MVRRMLHIVALIVYAAVAAACDPHDHAVGSSGSGGIDWFAGDVDAAFAAAEGSGKPVLLYWGAVWCPYCADLEAHVLSRADVRQKLELFVPVYLDGDETGAQRWGDAFGVAGYPTMLALAPDRTELARIAGGMDLSVYPEMLDLVLADLRPLADVLSAVEAGTPSADDCRRLAYNGWALDDLAAERTAYLASSLAMAAEQCAASGPVERARLDASAASFAVAAEAPELEPLIAQLVARVREIVAERALAVTIADVLRELDESYFLAARRVEPEHADTLLADWTAVMDAAHADTRYGHGDRLAALQSKIEATASLDPAGVTPRLAEEARERAIALLAEIGQSPARQGAVNAAINLLVTAGDLDEARALAERELAASRTPYYHMADLAWIDEMQGRHEDAIEWLGRAYRASTGPATRFQWGTSYVRGLIRMAPENEAAIREAALEVLAELDGPGRIYRRTRARLEVLDSTLREWSAHGDREATITALRRKMTAICGRVSQDEPEALASCKAFLSASADSA